MSADERAQTLAEAISGSMLDVQEMLAPERQAAIRAAEERKASERLAAKTRDQAEADAAAEAAWKLRLQKHAPIAEWELAWQAEPWPGVKAVDTWLEGGCKRHLCLFGGVGTGKSLAAAHAVKHWVRQAFPAPSVAWLKPNQFVSAVLHDYDEKSPRLGRYTVIDDMGFNEKPEFADALCDVLERPGLTLLITCNLRSDQFKERYKDPRLIDRLNHYAMAIRLKGNSRRRQDGGF
jgi:DNA replication protein DnaC